jgi:hypothetical protein
MSPPLQLLADITARLAAAKSSEDRRKVREQAAAEAAALREHRGGLFEQYAEAVQALKQQVCCISFAATKTLYSMFPQIGSSSMLGSSVWCCLAVTALLFVFGTSC